MPAIFTTQKDGSIKCVLPNGQIGYGGSEENAQFNAVFFPVAVEAAEHSVQLTDGILCKDCGHPVEYSHVAGCLNHPVRN